MRSYNPGPDTIAVEISDNGVGIEPRFLERIFDAFEQVDTRREGLGLGLAISKAIIETHGGTIRARSDGPGKGATLLSSCRRGPGRKAALAVSSDSAGVVLEHRLVFLAGIIPAINRFLVRTITPSRSTFLEIGQVFQHFFAVRGRLNPGVDFHDFALGIDDESVSRRHLGALIFHGGSVERRRLPIRISQ